MMEKEKLGSDYGLVILQVRMLRLTNSGGRGYEVYRCLLGIPGDRKDLSTLEDFRCQPYNDILPTESRFVYLLF